MNIDIWEQSVIEKIAEHYVRVDNISLPIAQAKSVYLYETVLSSCFEDMRKNYLLYKINE